MSYFFFLVVERVSNLFELAFHALEMHTVNERRACRSKVFTDGFLEPELLFQSFYFVLGLEQSCICILNTLFESFQFFV